MDLDIDREINYEHDTPEHREICLSCPMDYRMCHGDCWDPGKLYVGDRRRKTRVNWDKAEAYVLYMEGLNDREIAERLLTTQSAIQSWRKSNGLASNMGIGRPKNEV